MASTTIRIGQASLIREIILFFFVNFWLKVEMLVKIEIVVNRLDIKLSDGLLSNIFTSFCKKIHFPQLALYYPAK